MAPERGIMMGNYNNARYEAPEVALLDSEVWSGICAESVVTEVQYNMLEDVGQEVGEEINLSDNAFNHTWEEGE